MVVLVSRRVWAWESFVLVELIGFEKVDWLQDPHVRGRQSVRSIPAMPSI